MGTTNFDDVNATTATLGNSTFSSTGTISIPQIVTAAGATQGNATALTKSSVIITVATTASTHGVILPTAVTGKSVRIANAATFGVKVYPATGARIAAVATNGADTVLAINKVNTYIASSTTKWVVERGA